MKTYPPGGSANASAPIFHTCLKTKPFFLQFVAHPLNQQLLNNAVYSGVPRKIYGMPFKYKIPLFLLYTVIFPLLVLFYIVIPDNWVSEMMKTPYFKFISHISQFIMFQCLIAASALRDTRGATVIGKTLPEDAWANRPGISCSNSCPLFSVILVMFTVRFVLY
jgi:hypothetical protein